MNNKSLTLTPLTTLPLIKQGDDLAALIWQALQQEGIDLLDEDILVITQKIVSKAEGRMVDLAEVTPSQKALSIAAQTQRDPRLVELILQESKEILRITPEVIVVEHRLGFICANAGIDQSNVEPLKLSQPNGKTHQPVLLLPLDVNASAEKIKRALEALSGKHLGVLIIDTQGRAWRLGVVGMSIGLAGLSPLEDMRGEVDLFGKPLRITMIAAADELAAAASLMMGQAAEGKPVVHVRGYPYPLREGTFSQILRNKQSDLFR